MEKACIYYREGIRLVLERMKGVQEAYIGHYVVPFTHHRYLSTC
jgi:hypothetical protein